MFFKNQNMKIKQRLKNFRRRITYSEGFTDFAAFLLWVIIKLYFSTLKVRLDFDPEFLKLDRSRVLMGFWHGRQFLLVPSFGSWHIILMADLSWAGEIQTKILKRFGYRIVRGSSKRKGAQALLLMKNNILKGFAAGFAVDGPSGPIFKSKPGIVFLSGKLNYPIVPVVASSEKKWIIDNTWCKYQLPKPFSRCYVKMCEPVWPDKNFTSSDLDLILMNYTEKADKFISSFRK